MAYTNGMKSGEYKRESGFALVVTLSMLVLLTVIVTGLLSLSAISLRSSSQGEAQAEARSNARLALMLALGELQKEMGPDMRVSAKAAIFDSNPAKSCSAQRCRASRASRVATGST